MTISTFQWTQKLCERRFSTPRKHVSCPSLIQAHNFVGCICPQVKHGYALPPFNTLQLLLWWVPKRWRTRVPHQACLRLWLPPVDGYSSKQGPERCRAPLPTGPAELSYLLFLLTLYPVIALMATVLLFLRIPVGAVHFVSSGYKQWVAGDTRFGRGKHKGQQHHTNSRSSLDLAARGQSIDLNAAKLMSSQAARMRALVSMKRRMQQVAPEDLNWQQHALRRVGRDSCAALQGVNKGLTWVAAALTAAVVQLALVLVVVVVLTYSLAAQIVWTAWCVLFWWTLPQGMVTDHPPPHKRSADYWSAADLESSFRQHKVLHRHSMSRGSSATGQIPHQEVPAVALKARSARWSAPGSAEALQMHVLPPAGTAAMPGAASWWRSVGGVPAAPGGPGPMPLQLAAGGGPQPAIAPVYVECPSVAEPSRSISLQQPGLVPAADPGATLLSPDSSVTNGSMGTQSSNAPPAAWLVSHLSSILYSTDPPALPAPGPDTHSSSHSSTSASSETSSSQSPFGPVLPFPGSSTGAAAAVSVSRSSPDAGHNPPGTMAAHGTAVAAAAASTAADSQQALWPSVEGKVPCAPPGGFVVPTGMRPASSAARSTAALPGVP
jgi:hypothetical protein